MNVLDYSSYQADPLHWEKARVLEYSVKDNIRDYYFLHEPTYNALVVPKLLVLPLLIEKLGDLKGKTIIDLGCGSKEAEDSIYGNYHPWLCRVLHELGAHVIGIDIATLDEEFQTHQIDLLTSPIPNIKADCIHASGLFNAKHVLDTHSGEGPQIIQKKNNGPGTRFTKT